MNVVTATLLLLLMTALIANGVPMNTSQRCLCKGKLRDRVRCTNISGVRVVPASSSCDNKEIVVKLKKGRRVCLNPASRQGKAIQSSNSHPSQWISVQWHPKAGAASRGDLNTLRNEDGTPVPHAADCYCALWLGSCCCFARRHPKMVPLQSHHQCLHPPQALSKTGGDFPGSLLSPD